MPRSRNYSFTYNNYPDDYKDKLLALFNDRKMKYLVAGEETAESGTPHIQGHITLKNAATIKAIQKAATKLEIKFSLFSIKSTPQASITYCKKDGAWWDHGDEPAQGKRTDLSTMMESIKENPHKRKRQLMEEFPMTMARYSHFASEYKLLCMQDHLKTLDWKDGHSPNIWIYGPPGTGKSRAVREKYGITKVYSKQANKWWCGYDGQPVVLLEDIEPKHGVLSWHLKIWADRYPFLAQVKGSSINIRPPILIITSNYLPESIFDDTTICDAINRRFQIVTVEENPEWGSILPPTSV